MLLSDDSKLTKEQKKKVDTILATAGAKADGLLLTPSALQTSPEGSVCLSVLASIDKRGRLRDPRACLVELGGRHRWL